MKCFQSRSPVLQELAQNTRIDIVQVLGGVRTTIFKEKKISK